MDLLPKAQYETQISASRDRRMAWWREARFGMFIHLGLYSVYGKHEWAMAMENWPVSAYEKLAEGFLPKEGCCLAWAQLAKAAGMKYLVLTTRHHEGFSLWDSKINPYNSVKLGPGRDLVAEFVDACRAEGLQVGLYFSLMDWHHPDGGACAYDPAARARFTAYIHGLVRELITGYGRIDILWYDTPHPMESQEGWNSLALNQMVRSLQPDILINNRSFLEEDFQTPEGRILPAGRDWEACMTFNGISWGYLDSAQVQPYSHSAQQIVRMLHEVCRDGGNLLLNIGPRADGSVPAEAVGPLLAVGQWIDKHRGFIYGRKDARQLIYHGSSGLSFEGSTAQVWNFFWPSQDHTLYIAGIQSRLHKAFFMASGRSIRFSQDAYRIALHELPEEERDSLLGITMICLEFEGEIRYWGRGFSRHATRYPQLNRGAVYDPASFPAGQPAHEG